MWYLDEINVVKSEDTKKSAIAYQEYFSAMDITAKQLKRRIEMAQALEDALFILFLAWFYEADEDDAQEKFINDYLDAVEKFDDVGLEDEFVEYIVLLAASLRETTMRNKDDPYFTSFDRASYVAANEANTALNKIEHHEAKKNGMKYKTWHTRRDMRVRDIHWRLEGKTIPIDDLFDVDGAKMAYPKDLTYDPPAHTYVNCRCSASYSK